MDRSSKAGDEVRERCESHMIEAHYSLCKAIGKRHRERGLRSQLRVEYRLNNENRYTELYMIDIHAQGV